MAKDDIKGKLSRGKEKISEKIKGDKPKGKSSLDDKDKKKVKIIGAIVALLIIGFLGVFAVGIYKYQWEDDTTIAVARVVGYPAFFVNDKSVSYADYMNYMKAYTTYTEEFYIKGEMGIDVNSEEAQKILEEARTRIKDILISNAIIKEELDRRDIKYTTKEINDKFNEFVERTGGEEELEKNLNQYWGLTLEEFKNEIFIDNFLNEKLQEAISNDESMNEEAKKKAEEVLKEVKAGGDFKELAKKYSEDTSASKGGDLGFLEKGTIVPEFEDAVWKMKKGETSAIVKTDFGFHIIKLDDIDGEKRRVSHILIKTRDYEYWLTDMIENAEIKDWIK